MVTRHRIPILVLALSICGCAVHVLDEELLKRRFACSSDSDCPDFFLCGSDGICGVDRDGDGVAEADDCDDGNATSLTRAVDGDCDGVVAAEDCDDGDATSFTRAEDGDCDGVVVAEDCDDGDTNQPEINGHCFANIPSGTFTMGSPSGELGRYSHETQHEVTFTYDFAMGVTEVTQGQWKAQTGGANPSNFKSCGDNCPVEEVDWYSTIAYANALSRDAGLQECYTLTPSSCADDVSDWAGGDTSCTGATFVGLNCTGYRLPTEAEWEYAYRAGTTTAYYSGANSVTGCNFDANLDSIGWYCGNANNATHAVGSEEANAWGLSDMAGNVWEWTWDWYGTYLGATSDYIGPETGERRVLRGGSWRDGATYARAANRGNFNPDYRFIYLGFRLTRTLP